MTPSEADAGTILRALVDAIGFRESFPKALKRRTEPADPSWDELADLIRRAHVDSPSRGNKAPSLDVLEGKLRDLRLKREKTEAPKLSTAKPKRLAPDPGREGLLQQADVLRRTLPPPSPTGFQMGGLS